ncbi:Uncharacterized protein TPS_02292 [Trichinella pseudospiralis]
MNIFVQKEEIQAYASEWQIKLGHFIKSNKIMIRFFSALNNTRTVHAVHSYTLISFRELWIGNSSWR